MIRTSTWIALRAAEPFDLSLLEHAQQLDLDLRRQVADLVEEDRRAIGQFEAPDLPGEGAREGALLAAEQLALHERRRNRRAVDAHHRPRRVARSVRGAGSRGAPCRCRSRRAAAPSSRRRHLLQLSQDPAERQALTDDGCGAEALLDISPGTGAPRAADADGHAEVHVLCGVSESAGDIVIAATLRFMGGWCGGPPHGSPARSPVHRALVQASGMPFRVRGSFRGRSQPGAAQCFGRGFSEGLLVGAGKPSEFVEPGTPSQCW